MKFADLLVFLLETYAMRKNLRRLEDHLKYGIMCGQGLMANKLLLNERSSTVARQLVRVSHLKDYECDSAYYIVN
jgi:hypothetical protein